MFGAIKKMFKRGGSASQESSENAQPVAEQNSSANESYAAEPAVYSAPAEGSGESLRVSLKALVAQLPKELQGKNSPGPNEALLLRREEVLEQLAQGAVKVPFGEVRRVATTGVLAGGSSHDGRMVDVPLREILAQLRPEYFARRQDQRVIHVPDEIQDIFGAKGEARAQMRVMGKDEVKPSGRSEAAPEPTPMPAYQTPTAASFASPQLAPQERITIGGGRSAPPAGPAGPAMQPIQRNEFLIFNIAEISSNWPDAVKRELQRLNAQNSKCILPTAEIQEALKQGRVSYTWKQISGRLQPALAPHTQVTNDQAALELPIAVVASAFFTQTQQASNANRQVVKPPADIEPVFRGGPAGARPAAPAAPPPPRPVQPPPPQPAPQQPIRLKQEPPPAPAPAIPQAPRPAAPAAPPRPVAAAGTSKGNVVFKVSDVWANWPGEVKNHANNLRLNSAQVEIPFEMVEPGLRSGKIEFSWAEFCGWIVNCPAGAASLPAETRVALPLAVMAPLCLRLSPPSQRKADTLEHIPDIFGQQGQDEDDDEAEEQVFQKAPAPAPARPAAPPPRPAAPPPPPPPQPRAQAPAPSPIPVPAVPSGPDPGTNAKNLADLFGEPGKRNWTPNEIVQRTSQLPGVAGALIALQDGLLVANCMPQGWKTETIAAFLPQIFGRMSQYVKELSMGDLISVTVAVEQGTLQVYKAGIIYFAALARPDGTLPLAALNLIARELSRHTK